MRSAIIIFACLLSACGPSQSEIDATARAEEAIRERDDLAAKTQRDQRATAIQACKDKDAEDRTKLADRIHQDQSMIRTSLDEIAREGASGGIAATFGFKAEIESLDANEWRWTEEENRAAADSDESGGLFDKVRYTVSPRALSNTVVASTYRGMPAIRINCASTSRSCIRAFGRQIVDNNGSRSLVDIDEKRDQNYWPMGTQTKAQAFAEAMSSLLQNLAATPPNRNCETVVDSGVGG